MTSLPQLETSHYRYPAVSRRSHGFEPSRLDSRSCALNPTPLCVYSAPAPPAPQSASLPNPEGPTTSCGGNLQSPILSPRARYLDSCGKPAPLVHSGPQPPSPSTNHAPAAYSSSPSDSGRIPQVPPISSLAGAQIRSCAPIRLPVHFEFEATPRLQPGLSLHPKAPNIAFYMLFTHPSTSNPWGSILGYARQTAPLVTSCSRPPQPQPAFSPAAYKLLSRLSSGYDTSHRYQVRGARFSATRAQTGPSRASRVPGPHGFKPASLSQYTNPPPRLSSGYEHLPPIWSPWSTIFGYVRQTGPLSCVSCYRPPALQPASLPQIQAPPAASSGYKHLAPISSPWARCWLRAPKPAPSRASCVPAPRLQPASLSQHTSSRHAFLAATSTSHRY